MEEQQNTLKMKIDPNTVFHINYRLKSVCFFVVVFLALFCLFIKKLEVPLT